MNATQTILPPWLHTTLSALPPRNRLGHALLLIDPQRGNARHIAHYLLQSLLCLNEQNTATPCGTCKSCHLITQHTHPDAIIHEQVCDIKEIRAINQRVQHTPSIAPCRVIVLTDIDQYHDAAISALLKTLEEPPADHFFILCAHNRRAVKATISSRCQAYNIPPPSRAQALAWLIDEHQWDANTAAQALTTHHDNPYQALTDEGHDPSIGINEHIAYLSTPKHQTAYLSIVDRLPAATALDTVCTQLYAIIHAAQLDSCTEYWHNHLKPLWQQIQSLDVHRLHSLYAHLITLRCPHVQQVGMAINIKHCLLAYAQSGKPTL